MHYQSLIKKLQVIMKPGGKKMNEAGDIIATPIHKLRFTEYEYHPKDNAEEKFLDNYLTRPGKRLYWKVTNEEITFAKEYKADLEILQKKYAEKKKELDKILGKKKTAGTGASLTKGISSTGSGEVPAIEAEMEKETKANPNWREELIAKAKAEAKSETDKEKDAEIEALKKQLVEKKKEEIVDVDKIKEGEQKTEKVPKDDGEFEKGKYD